MKIDIGSLEDFIARDALRQHSWGDARETACLVSALTGTTDTESCEAVGWPLWLAELYVYLFDAAPENEATEWARQLAAAAKIADERGVDWDRCKRDIRLRAIPPIALESVGNGDEPWRMACRDAVQWSLDHDGAENLSAAEAAGAAGAARAAGAAGAAGAACAAWAAGARWAAEAAEAAAWRRIYETTCAVLRGGTTGYCGGDEPLPYADRLTRERENLDKALDEVTQERDAAQDALETAALTMGSEWWVAKIPPELPPASGDLTQDVPALAKQLVDDLERVTRERDEAVVGCARLREALNRIQGWRETDLPEGSRAARAIEYMESVARAALAGATDE